MSKPAPLSDLTVFIVREGDKLITDSRAVAVAFGKQHQHILRTIDAMMRSRVPLIAEHAASNFGRSFFSDAAGRQRRMFSMTAKGFSELAMSFTGDDSRAIRIRFLGAFEEMAQRLQSAEKSLMQRLHQLDLDERPSVAKGKLGSKLLNERRAEKPDFTEKRATMLALIQPSLFGPH